MNSSHFDKLITLLKELFQLDRPDLDFGFYRIMHAKSAEVTRFLEEDLLAQVKAALSHYQSADKAVLQKELDEACKGAAALRMNPDDSPTVRDLRAKLTAAVDVNALESEVYDHLYGFFRRYYSDGDFLSKPVYKPGVYAIPYEGEEVKLHWANADQYYIKTDEYLRNYAFRLRPDDPNDPMRVRFHLVNATEGEHRNVKVASAKKRAFLLTETDFIAEEDGEHGKELVVRFEYRPATLADWPENERKGKKRPPLQTRVCGFAEQRLLAVEGRQYLRWIKALRSPHFTSDGEKTGTSHLRVHLDRYTARNTFDCFIHKDLGGFLRRELDFYIKNEVMHLDDVENETAPRVEQYLSKIKAIRHIASQIIDFLAQLEDFQKKLWTKKKFVLETSYCIPLGRVPEEFHDEIAANDEQIREWTDLGAISDSDSEEYPMLSVMDCIHARPSLVLDTQYFARDFTDRLVATLSCRVPLNDQCDGLLLRGENLHALTLLRARYRNQVRCIYIDPPYNTGNDGFLYKDNYRHSSWLSLMHDRIAYGRALIEREGAIICSIDEIEQPRLRELLRDTWGEPNFVADTVWAAGRKNDSQLISVSHEYMTIYAASRQHLTDNKIIWRQKKKGLKDIYAQYSKLKKKYGSDYVTMTRQLKKWFASLSDDHPAKKHRHYRCVDHRGVYFPRDISWPGIGGPRYEVAHPKTHRPVTVPRHGWRLTQKKMKQYIRDDRIHFGEDEQAVPCIKAYLTDQEDQAPYSVIYQDGRAATKRLRNVLGMTDFGYPKDEGVIAEYIDMVSRKQGIVLDYFAGSGTTGHAVINLNREDGGERKFVLVEMGDHFDTVLIPRIKRITFAPEWKDGKPKRVATDKETKRSPRIIKVLRLESYEDTLNNLIEPQRPDGQQRALDQSAHRDSAAFREEYMLRYMLDVDTRGSPSLLNVGAFADPTSYGLKVKRPGSDECREVNVDLLETFNWLIGLSVHHIAAPRMFDAGTERDGEGRLRLKGELEAGRKGRWSFRTVTGTMPDGRKALIVWRRRPGGETPDGMEQDNLVLDEWFKSHGYLEGELDRIYINGSNNLENLKAPTDTWTVRLIEDDFHRLMFEPEGL